MSETVPGNGFTKHGKAIGVCANSSFWLINFQKIYIFNFTSDYSKIFFIPKFSGNFFKITFVVTFLFLPSWHFSLFRIITMITVYLTLFGATVVYILLSSKIIQKFMANFNANFNFCLLLFLVTISILPITFLKSPADFW